MKAIFTALLLATSMGATAAAAQDYQRPGVPSLRDRVAAHDRLIKARLDTVVPKIMREVGVDMWVLVSSEYNEDPVVKTMLPATWASARRTMVLIVTDGLDTGEPQELAEELAWLKLHTRRILWGIAGRAWRVHLLATWIGRPARNCASSPRTCL